MFGRMAFGGAGVFASTPLLSKMAERWPECYEQFRYVFGGDEMLTRCAALARGVEKDDVVTREAGLHREFPDSQLSSQNAIPFGARR